MNNPDLTIHNLDGDSMDLSSLPRPLALQVKQDMDRMRELAMNPSLDTSDEYIRLARRVLSKVHDYVQDTPDGFEPERRQRLIENHGRLMGQLDALEALANRMNGRKAAAS